MPELSTPITLIEQIERTGHALTTDDLGNLLSIRGSRSSNTRRRGASLHSASERRLGSVPAQLRDG